MRSHFSKAFAVALGGFLASCASTPHSASVSGSLQGRPQLADAQRSPADAELRAGAPLARGTAAGACALIPEAEQNVCPLQRTPVLGARQLVRPLDPKGYSFTPAGAVVYSLAAPGLTPEWFGHLVECYQARVVSDGNALQARESCPLAEPESSYSVTPTHNGFAVSIRSPHTEAAKRIFDVSERLAPSDAPQLSRVAVRQ
jgi:hypothetical protein